MKVYFCDLVHNLVAGDNQISGGADFVVPLGIANIAAYTKKMLWDRVDVSLFKYPNDLLSAVTQDPPDVLAFSNYYWAKDLNARVGSLIKERNPNILTVMGGPSIRTDRAGIEMFLRENRYIDVYIMYEGERPMVELLKAFDEGGRRILDRVTPLHGSAYLAEGTLVYEQASQNEGVDEFESPYLNGMLDPFLQLGQIPLFETNRGCPYECTFCTWGIAAFNKVRRYPIDRVFGELEYVATNFPNMPAWIIADGNFGILRRDVEIAEKIKELREKTPALRHILTWESKNTSDRNFEIAQIMGNDVGDVLMAVQTLDPVVQESIKRDNINMDHVPQKIETFHSIGANVETHVLSGLPGETYNGHLDTLRKCFDLGFDLVHVFSTLLLPGSEMESEESRSKYALQTKFRLRQGAYGEYQGIRSIDAEEIIRTTSTINEDEMLALRPVHWLVWYAWNHGFLKPILQFAQREHGINPLDVIIETIKIHGDGSHPRLAKMFVAFDQEAESEWFSSSESLQEFYTDRDQWDDLLNNGFSKVEFRYNAEMILDTELFNEMLELVVDIIRRRAPECAAQEFVPVLQSMRIEPDSYLGNGIAPETTIQVSPAVAGYLAGALNSNGHRNSGNSLRLMKTKTEQLNIREHLLRYGFGKNKRYAVEKTLGVVHNAFTYDLSFAE